MLIYTYSRLLQESVFDVGQTKEGRDGREGAYEGQGCKKGGLFSIVMIFVQQMTFG